MSIKRRIEKTKEYLGLLHQSCDAFSLFKTLEATRSSISDSIFKERLQPTKGFFIAKPTNFIVPNDWGKSDPCAVTIYRHGVYDPIWEDGIINCGKKDDVKTFHCPHFNDNKPCNMECKYREKNNDFFAMDSKIQDAEEKYAAIVAQRKAAWKQIFARESK